MIFNLYKQRGETPLECLERFRESRPELAKEKMTYLGRLDPMAEGVLLVGTGEDTSQENREKYFGFDKEYDFVALFGFRTDTYDCLGKITYPLAPSPREGEQNPIIDIDELDLIKLCKVYEGEREQKYPEYSSYTFASLKTFPHKVLGSPRTDSVLTESVEARLSSEKFSSKRITIHKLQFHKLDKLTNKELFGRLLMDISKVKGDFRQTEILEGWKKILIDGLGSPSLVIREGPHDSEGMSYLAHFSTHVSSGTYIRSLVNDMGNTLGCGATTLSIVRTRVGEYNIRESIK